MKNKIEFFIIGFIILLFIVINIWINKINYNKFGDYCSGNEFVQTIDCAPLFDANPKGTKYKICFELKTAIPGNVIVYQQNGSSCRYSWSPFPIIEAEKEFVHYEIEVEPFIVDEKEDKSYLAFYGEYGTGVIPVIRNIIIIPI